MGCKTNTCEVPATLGGEKFNALSATFNPVNSTSLGDGGRHGAKNTWARWNNRQTPNNGIVSRAPYGTPPISKAKLANVRASLGGKNTHYRGIGQNQHGHGIGVVPSAIGGPHATRRVAITVKKPTRAAIPTDATSTTGLHHNQGRTAMPLTWCPKCFTTWALVGGGLFVVILLSSR